MNILSVSRKNKTTNTSKDTKIKANSKDNKTPVIVDEETSEFLNALGLLKAVRWWIWVIGKV